MGIELPGWLTEPLSWITLEWPQADETKLFEAGQVWMNFGMTVIPIGMTAKSAAENVWTINEGPQVDAFENWWNDEDGPTERLTEDGIGAMLIGAALFVFAAVTLAMKIAWIVSLIILAVQVAMAIAASFATFGAASASIPGFIAVCRQICMKVLRKVIDDVIKKSIKELLEKARKLFKKVATRKAAKKAAEEAATNKRIMDQIADSLKKINPNFRQGREYQTNCPNCAAAYELRRRGFNAEAAPLDGGRPRSATEGLWGRRYTHGTPDDILRAFSEPGSRGTVGVDWPHPSQPGKTAGAHVFNVENIGGRIHFFDAQTGNLDASGHLTKGINHRYIRTDDIPTPDMNTLFPGWIRGGQV